VRLAATVLLNAVRVANAVESPSDARLVHVFLRVEISPDGALVASVEGDSPVTATTRHFGNWSSGTYARAPKRRFHYLAGRSRSVGPVSPRGAPTAVI